MFLLFCGAEIWLEYVILRLVGCPKWLLGREYEVIIPLLVGCMIGRVKRAQPQVSMTFWSKDMISLSLCQC